MKSVAKILTAGLLLLVMSGCSVVRQSAPVTLAHTNRIAVFPFANNTATPQASQRAVSMSSHLLNECRLQVMMYPTTCQSTVCQYSKTKQQKMRAWARRQGIHYALTGAVNEWRYKVGLDGEPAVSLSLSIVDVQTGRVVWSAVGSKSGASRSSLGNTALTLLSKMLDNVRWS
jgi:TolB-like protein